MNKEIVNLLKKYYLHYDNTKWKEFSNNNTENIKEDFYKIWKKEHGGYYLKSEMSKFNPPKYLPYCKNKFICIPEIAYNNIKFQEKYVKTLNKLLIDNDTKHIKLDFRNNYGGKPQVMIAGLLPLFNLSKNKILTYITTKSKTIKDVYIKSNCVTCISNNNASICGTNLKLTNVKKISIYINKYTISSAEQSIIALLSLKDILEINICGHKSGGFTTCNKYIELSNGDGIEIPIGYMTDTNFNVYKNGFE